MAKENPGTISVLVPKEPGVTVALISATLSIIALSASFVIASIAASDLWTDIQAGNLPGLLDSAITSFAIFLFVGGIAFAFWSWSIIFD